MNPASLPARAPALPPRARAALWLRKTHGWIGLWGAGLGLLFGFSGLWLNHRAVLPLSPALTRSTLQLELPAHPPRTPAELGAWLQQALGLAQPPFDVRIEPARALPWAEQPAHRTGRSPAPAASTPAPALLQPEHWTLRFGGPRVLVQAEYWVGNRSVSVRTTANGAVATLMSLHTGAGMPVAWILLVDTLAGSLVLLSLSGLALWMLTRRRRALGLVVASAALIATAALAFVRP